LVAQTARLAFDAERAVFCRPILFGAVVKEQWAVPEVVGDGGYFSTTILGRNNYFAFLPRMVRFARIGF
jgi:hypothetical protein